MIEDFLQDHPNEAAAQIFVDRLKEEIAYCEENKQYFRYVFFTPNWGILLCFDSKSKQKLRGLFFKYNGKPLLYYFLRRKFLLSAEESNYACGGS